MDGMVPPSPLAARIVVRTWSRVLALAKAAVAFFISLAALGLVIDGFEALGESPSSREAAVRIGSVVAGILGAPLAFWVGLSALRAGLVLNARLEISDEGLRIVHPQLFRKPVKIPRGRIAGVMSDERAARLRRFRDHLRFELQGDPRPGEPDHLFSKVGGAPFPVLSQVKDVPNVAIGFTEPLKLQPTRRWLKLFPARSSLHPPIHGRRSRGILVRLKDPHPAIAAFEAWGVVRTFSHADLDPIRPTDKDRQVVRRLAIVDGSLMAFVFAVIFVLPVLTADPLEGPVLSPGFGVCRQMAEALARNPSSEGDNALVPGLLSDLLPDLKADGYFVVEGGAIRPSSEEGDLFADRLQEAGFQQGNYERWVAPGAQILIEIVQLGDEDSAGDYHRATLGDTCTEASEVFEVTSIPGAVGMRWFTNIGLLDQVTFTKGDLHVYVAVAATEREPDRAKAIDLARSIATELS